MGNLKSDSYSLITLTFIASPSDYSWHVQSLSFILIDLFPISSKAFTTLQLKTLTPCQYRMGPEAPLRICAETRLNHEHTMRTSIKLFVKLLADTIGSNTTRRTCEATICFTSQLNEHARCVGITELRVKTSVRGLPSKTEAMLQMIVGWSEETGAQWDEV